MVGPMLLLEVFVIASLLHFSIQSDVDLKCSKIWGPGLKPHVITMPARYFFVKAVNCNSSIRYVKLYISICIFTFIKVFVVKR